MSAFNNNINSYIALYPVKIYEIAVLYIIKIHLTIKKAEYYKCINQYQHDKKPRWKQNKNKNKKNKEEEEAQVL